MRVVPFLLPPASGDPARALRTDPVPILPISMLANELMENGETGSPEAGGRIPRSAGQDKKSMFF